MHEPATERAIERRCWCGGSRLHPFGGAYGRCDACGTLVRREVVATGAGERYGRRYWFERQRELGLPDLEARSRSDLEGRCLAWLELLSRYRMPPARVLEIGCSHGGFIALLRRAGYDATGHEISAWVADYARRTFQVPVLDGAVDELPLEAGGLDVVVAMDVLEHVDDPVSFLRRIADLLTRQGLLVVQTPHLSEESFERLRLVGSPTLEMLVPEHLFLYGKASIVELLTRAGLPHCSFEPPVFATDMILVASREPPRSRPWPEVAAELAATPDGRLLAALLGVGASVRTLRRELAAVDRERSQRGWIIERLTGDAESQGRVGAGPPVHVEDAGALTARLEAAEDQNRRLRELLDGYRRSGIARALVAVGRWRDHDRRVSSLLGPAGDPVAGGELSWRLAAAPPPASSSGPTACDLTSVLPGGENGGAKVAAVAIVEALARRAGDRELILLTGDAGHAELESLDGPRVRRRRMGFDADALIRLADEVPIRELLCPFTAPPWLDPRVPLVSVVHDLQHEAYPGFFAASEIAERRDHLARTCRESDLVLTPSAFTRQQLLATRRIDAERVRAVPWRLADRLPAPGDDAVATTLRHQGLEADRYFVYPANAWPHKNHRLLVTAFARLHHERPDLDLRLVLTGAERPDPGEVLELAHRMGLEGRVLHLGFIDDDELAALLAGCRGLVYPSLYEGFGLPVAEAMAMGKPVVASDVGALAEVAGDAARLVDPRDVEAIYRGLLELATDDELAAELARRGRRRAARYADAERLADELAAALDAARSAPRPRREGLAGRYRDGWTAGELCLAHHGGAVVAELVLTNPRQEAVGIATGCGRRATVAAGGALKLRCTLPAAPGFVRFSIGPLWAPGGEDWRRLGLRLESATLHGARSRDLLAEAAGE